MQEKLKRPERKPVKIKLIFSDWEKNCKEVDSETYFELSIGVFHGGSTFNGTISLNEFDREELIKALKNGFQPVFYVVAEDE